THLVWDAFTQVGGFAVAHWQVLREPVVGAHRVFNVLMYVSSAGGLLILGGWLVWWYRRAPGDAGRPSSPGWVRGVVLAAAAVAGRRGSPRVQRPDVRELGGWPADPGRLACVVVPAGAG